MAHRLHRFARAAGVSVRGGSHAAGAGEADREVRRDLAGACRQHSSRMPTTYDAGKEPAGWRLPGFDDAAWPTCREVKRCLGAAGAQRDSAVDGGALSGRAPRGPAEPDHSTEDGSFRVVFDRVLSAYPTLKVEGRQGGA